MDLRLFIALELPDTFQRDLWEDLSSLRKAHPEFRWTGQENQHLTLAFLGSVPETGLPLILEALEGSVKLWQNGQTGPAGKASSGVSNFDTSNSETGSSGSGIEISARDLHTFPHRKPASVLAVGLGDGADVVSTLAAILERELLAVKDRARLAEYEASRRPFTPHITVARAGRAPIRLEQEERLFTLAARGLVRSMALFSSVLQRGGPVYTVQGRIFL